MTPQSAGQDRDDRQGPQGSSGRIPGTPFSLFLHAETSKFGNQYFIAGFQSGFDEPSNISPVSIDF
jgi:hypothetical protein